MADITKAVEDGSVEDSNTQTIKLIIAGEEFSFLVTRADYNKYVNSLVPNSKVAPSHNFLVATVSDEGKTSLLNILSSSPGSEIAITGEVLAEYMPDLAITVKKPKKKQNK
ncbi:putative phage tail assembly chaperone [Microbulbifer variabilis]|uniref:Phage tail assembly chaperone n=1 Tax=Microbulbifer variabilis TaxID=266805 RepID=A0ABY4V661_9GAMM|nr:putative phage tail assembly chaperone [Microbulbifer variabilis]USD19765.1 putative phage tail assembly chaperone [Microbulbifer variabilis]